MLPRGGPQGLDFNATVRLKNCHLLTQFIPEILGFFFFLNNYRVEKQLHTLEADSLILVITAEFFTRSGECLVFPSTYYLVCTLTDERFSKLPSFLSLFKSFPF